MMSNKKYKNRSGSTFKFTDNVISESAFGDYSSVVNINSVDSETLDEFSKKLSELQSEVTKFASNLPKDEISKIENEISIIESELSNHPVSLTPKVIFDALQSINKILGTATSAGVILKQLFDILMSLIGGS